jgi:arylsulfatase A-like enzyme
MYDPAKIPLPPNFKPFHPFDNGEMTIRDEKLARWPRGEDEIRGHLRNYYAMITHMDMQFGRIFQALKDAGEFDNTIVVFSSDQGIAIGSHGLMGKQNLYEPSMGVPLIFAGPGIPAGKETGAFAYHFDIMPTVLDLVGAAVPTDIDGKSLAGVIRGRSEGVRDTIFLAYKDIQRAVRKGPWKLLRYPKVDKTQLFNLADDPHETKDLSGDPAQAGRVKEMLALMAEQQKVWDDKDPLTVENPAKAEVDLDFFGKPATKAQSGDAKPKNKAKRKDKAKNQ